jgi:hypothetical protein
MKAHHTRQQVEEFGGNVSEDFPIPDATYWNVWLEHSVIDPMTCRP